MSIPLVQNNEKDSINTSIIAIKRNIERINMLLGLSNSEEIDTSVFATKDELQQAVTDLQPVDEVAVDNMHSVTSNAIANILLCSTTEHKTGKKWINGKDIYCKVKIVDSLNTGSNNIPETDIEQITMYSGYCEIYGGKRPFPFIDDGGYSARIAIYNSTSMTITTSYPISNLQIYMEYTKTTD